jgi:integrase
MRRSLFEQVSQHAERSRLNPSSFSYALKMEDLPKPLRRDIAELVRFHRDASPGRHPDGSSKRRTKKSHWKVRSTDGRCHSQENLYALLGSFFGYCVLPSDQKAARSLVQGRLKKTAVNWRREDLSLYDSWLIGAGMKIRSLSFDLLLDTSLVEQWLNWVAQRNGGMSKTQSTYCIILCGLFNEKTGAVSQCYEIARKIMKFPVLPRVLTREDRVQFGIRMEEWARTCEETKRIYKDFRQSFSSSKVKRKRRSIQRHEKLLSLENPLAVVHKMLNRLHLSEPRHLGTTSQSWKLWVRNVTLVELLISNPLRADNICYLRYSPEGIGTLRKIETGYEIFIEKYEVKNPHDEKEFGYRGDVNSVAAAWLEFYINEVRPYWETRIPADERLFLTRTGKPIDVIELRSILIKLSQQFLPEYPALNTHAFRHIVATSWLKQNPDDYITVSLILGDRLATVMNEYAHLASKDGLTRYHRYLAQRKQIFPSAEKER